MRRSGAGVGAVRWTGGVACVTLTLRAQAACPATHAYPPGQGRDDQLEAQPLASPALRRAPRHHDHTEQNESRARPTTPNGLKLKLVTIGIRPRVAKYC